MGVNARLERTWDVLTIHVVVWPCGEIDAERLADACVRVARVAHRSSYIARRIAELAAADGVTPDDYLDRHGHAFVGAVDCSSSDELATHLWNSGRVESGLPFGFVVASEGLGLVYSHELGDGHVFRSLFRAVLTAYADPTSTPTVATRVASDRELLTELFSTWARRPRAAVDAVTGVARQMRRLPPARTVRDDRVAVPVRREVVVIDEDELAVIDAWRRRQDPRPSTTTALLWLVSRALLENGYPSPQSWQVMVNLRGASKTWSAVGGNLVGRILLDVGRDTTASGISEEVRRQAGGTELLAQHALKMARGLVRMARSRLRRRRAGEETVSVGRSPGLSWSDIGRFSERAMAPVLPRRSADRDQVRPGLFIFTGPFQEGLGTTVAWVEGRAILSFTFGASPLDDDAVDRVLATLRDGVSRLLPADHANVG